MAVETAAWRLRYPPVGGGLGESSIARLARALLGSKKKGLVRFGSVRFCQIPKIKKKLVNSGQFVSFKNKYKLSGIYKAYKVFWIFGGSTTAITDDADDGDGYDDDEPALVDPAPSRNSRRGALADQTPPGQNPV